MTLSWNHISRQHISLIINILASLFFITVLMFKKGYSYVPMMLGGISVIYLLLYLFKFKQKWTLDKEDKGIIFAFLLYFATFVISAVVHGDGFREVDNPSRVLLFIPMILLFSQFPINTKILFHTIPVGALIAGLIAIYQKLYLNETRAFISYMSIQAGDISMTLGVLSLAIVFYFLSQQQYKTASIYMLFSLSGMSASVLANTRGAWISIIITLPLLFWLYRKYISKKLLLIIAIVLSIFIGLSLSSPHVIAKLKLIKTQSISYIEKNNAKTSVGARLDMWNSALLAFQEKPILGWGSKGYIQLKKEQVSEKKIHPMTLTFNDAHNQYLDMAAKRGIVGILGLFVIFLIPLTYFLRSLSSIKPVSRALSILGVFHIISAMIYGLTQTFLAHNSGSIFYFFLVIVFYSLIKINENSES